MPSIANAAAGMTCGVLAKYVPIPPIIAIMPMIAINLLESLT
jgi:hypothetical protein